jgi:hypothetical protein
MKTQQLHHPSKHVQLTFGNLWLWFGVSILLVMTALTINHFATYRTMVISDIGPYNQAQAVPDASTQGLASYLNAHSMLILSAQSMPDAAAQGVTAYLMAHGNGSAQSVPDAAAQSVAAYIRLHSGQPSTSLIKDPATQSVMNYLKVHGVHP